MKQDGRILIVGGDKRQRLLFDLLSTSFRNTVYANSGTEDEVLKEIEKSEVIVFPIPFSKDKKTVYSDNPEFSLKKERALERLVGNVVVFGGGFSKEEWEFFEEENMEYHDFLLNESFLFENAYLTAEGALRLLLDNTEESLFNKKVLVTGYGRISELLCCLLKKLNMKVYTAARNEIQLKHAEKSGCIAVNLNNMKDLREYDYIFNTVPMRLFDETLIATMKKGIYFELASAPFGADKNQLVSMGIRYVDGGSLPGRLFPLSSAKLLRDYIMKYI